MNRSANIYLKEIIPFAYELQKLGVKFIINTTFNGYQIVGLRENSTRAWDCICHDFSYGRENGLLEFYGDILKGTEFEGDVTNGLTAAQGIELVKDYLTRT